MTGWFAPFIFYLARCTENELRRQVELLKAENEILRKRVPKKRIFLAKEERDLLLKLGTAIGPGASKLVTVVHRRTYQRWVREKNAGKPAKKMGRPKTIESVKEIVIRIAKETSWGYDRIVGELRKLRIRSVSVGTVKNILKEAGVKPGPNRGPGSGTWNEFLKAHVDSLWQVDFLQQDDLDADRTASSVCAVVPARRDAAGLLFALQLCAGREVDGRSGPCGHRAGPGGGAGDEIPHSRS